MNKTERDRLLGYISKGRFFGRETAGQLDRLRVYIDTLEEIVECVARNKNTALGHQAREALDRGE